VHLEASTKPHVHQKVEIFWTNIASTMACPNFKNGPKTRLRLLGVKLSISITSIDGLCPIQEHLYLIKGIYRNVQENLIYNAFHEALKNEINMLTIEPFFLSISKCTCLYRNEVHTRWEILNCNVE
jgi:hypothetical protein